MRSQPVLRVVPPADAVVEPARAWSLDELFRCHSRYVAAIGLRILGRSDEVDDLVQDVFVEAQRGLAGVREPAAVKGWLATIAVRCAQRKLRRRRLRGWLGLDSKIDYTTLEAAGASPEEAAMLAEVYARLDRLPVAARMAWTLRHLEGEPLERVAELCGCSLATAKRRIAAAQQALAHGDDHED